MAETRTPSRREAIRILERCRAETHALLDRLPPRTFTVAGLGGGEWSPKDLIGHLASWEEHALDALAAWERGERAPIDELLRSLGTNRVNRQDVERKARWSPARVRREAERVHAELLSAIAALPQARWAATAGPRARRPLALRVGAILGGPAGPYRHDESHHPSLRSFLRDHGDAAERPSASEGIGSRRSTR